MQSILRSVSIIMYGEVYYIILFGWFLIHVCSTFYMSCNILWLVNILFAQSSHYKQLVPGVIVVSWFIAILPNCGVIRPSLFKLIFIVFLLFFCLFQFQILLKSVRLLNSWYIRSMYRCINNVIAFHHTLGNPLFHFNHNRLLLSSMLSTMAINCCYNPWCFDWFGLLKVAVRVLGMISQKYKYHHFVQIAA